MESKKYRLNRTDFTKIGKGAGIAAGGAALTYLLIVITDVDFGSQTPIIVAVGSILINAVLKLLKKGS